MVELRDRIIKRTSERKSKERFQGFLPKALKRPSVTLGAIDKTGSSFGLVKPGVSLMYQTTDLKSWVLVQICHVVTDLG